MSKVNQGQDHCRFAIPEDIDFIFHSLRNLVEEQGTADKFSQTPVTLYDALFSRQPFVECIIAIADKQPVGLLMFSVTNHNFILFPSPGLFVHDIYVSKDYRRKGIAQALGIELIQIAKDRNCSRIDGIILKDNATGVAFYRSLDDLKVLDYINYMRLTLR